MCLSILLLQKLGIFVGRSMHKIICKLFYIQLYIYQIGFYVKLFTFVFVLVDVVILCEQTLNVVLIVCCVCVIIVSCYRCRCHRRRRHRRRHQRVDLSN